MAETEGVMIAEKALGVSIPHSNLDAQKEQAATAGDLGTNAAARAKKRAEAGPHLKAIKNLADIFDAEKQIPTNRSKHERMAALGKPACRRGRRRRGRELR